MAFRDNEASLVGAVLAARAANDAPALVAAACAFWLAPPERPDEPDASAREVWQAVVDARLVDEARAAILPALREGRTIRPHAYIDLVESTGARPLLLELADLALAHALPAVPYLAAPCFALVDDGADEVLVAWLQANEAALAATAERWVLVGVILTTTWVGNRHDLSRWFVARADPPMWLAQLYVATLRRREVHLMSNEIYEVVQAALARESRDVTFDFFLIVEMLRKLDGEDFQGFLARWTEHAERFAADPPEPDDHPVWRFINAARHTRALTASDLHGDPDRNRRWAVGLFVSMGTYWGGPARELFPRFARMIALPYNSPEATQLEYAMRDARAQNALLPGMHAAWRALVFRKLSFGRRLPLLYFFR